MTISIGTPDKDRAKTVKEREELLYDLLECWTRAGDLRLGQFLNNAVGYYLLKHGDMEVSSGNIDHYSYYMEDRIILAAAREFVRDHFPLAGDHATSS